jgi:hypothetical protein
LPWLLLEHPVRPSICRYVSSARDRRLMRVYDLRTDCLVHGGGEVTTRDDEVC